MILTSTEVRVRALLSLSLRASVGLFGLERRRRFRTRFRTRTRSRRNRFRSRPVSDINGLIATIETETNLSGFAQIEFHHIALAARCIADDDGGLVAFQPVIQHVHHGLGGLLDVNHIDRSRGQTLTDKPNGAIPVSVITQEVQVGLIGALANQVTLLITKDLLVEGQGFVHMQSDGSAERRVDTDIIEEITCTIFASYPVDNGGRRTGFDCSVSSGLTVVAEVVVVGVDSIVLELIVEIPHLASRNMLRDGGEEAPNARDHAANDQQQAEHRNQCAPAPSFSRHSLTFLFVQISGNA